ncbi:MAG: CDP-alcohol phosphatidyltransferase family protein [Clostridia bacterium]|nr:CDP-alcohol phosphatidyltransferase family protein [Clostridia bacterium]
MKKHIPNIITGSRLLMVPLFVIFMVQRSFAAAAIVYLAAALSDLLDGYLARKWKVVSNFGKLADPLADKAIQICAILLLCIVGKLHFAFVVIMLIKEGLMIYGSYLLYKEKVVVYAVWYGKLATFLLNAAIFWILILNLGNAWTNSLIGIAMVSELIALSLYTKRYFKLKKQAAEKAGDSE